MQHTANRFSPLADDKTEDFMVFYTAQSMYFYDATWYIFVATKWWYFRQLRTFFLLALVNVVLYVPMLECT